MADSAKRNVRLGDLRHRDRRLNTDVDTSLFEKVLECESVHNCAQHTHVVCPAALHAALFKLCSPKEVASTDDDCDLCVLRALCDCLSHRGDYVWVYTEGSPTESLTRKFEQYSALLSHDHPPALTILGVT